MPPPLGDRLIHIIEAIEIIHALLSGQTVETLSKDLPKRLALERLFEIISEASRHVPADVKTKRTEIDWQRMADLGNVLRHAYHRVNVVRLMRIAEADLPALKTFVEEVIRNERRDRNG